MTVERLRELNPDLTIYTTDDKEFAEYGVVLSGDTTEICAVASKKPMPESGSVYEASTKEFEALSIAADITALCYGEMPTQIGYCYGHSNFLNAFEWHTSSEINIAVTDLVLLLAKRSELADNKIDASCAKIFYIKKGQMIEVFATSMHFCPCEVDQNGFGCVVALPEGTNIPLEETSRDPYLFRKNKWIIAHHENEGLIARGVMPGISGDNTEIKY